MQGILDLPGTMAQSLQELATTMAFGRDPMPPPQLADHDRRVVVPARLKRREQDRRSLGCLLALGHEPQL